MEIILIQDVDNLGAKNEVVKVKNGYARNYLLPRQLAVENSPSNKKQLEERLKQVRKKEDKMLAEINSVIAKLNEAPLKLGAKTGTSGKIFGRPWIAAALAILAGLLAFSRIYLSQHFVEDVLCGAIIGTGTSWLVYWWLYRSAFAQRSWLDGSLLRRARSS